MNKKLWSVIAAAALVASVFSALPAKAAPEIPDEVQIDDPFGDANGINDQGNGGSRVAGNEVPYFGDVEGPADASTVADLGKIWFTNDADTISVHVQTEAPLGNSAPAYVYDVFSNAGEGTVASSIFWCLRFSTLIPGSAEGTNWQGETQVKLVDRCNVGPSYWSDSADGEIEFGEGPDGTGILTMTFPRAHSPLLGQGGVITLLRARTTVATGEESQVGFVAAPVIDNTELGADYQISDGDIVSGTPVMEEPPTVTKPKKQNCKKIKNKKKRKKCIKRNKKLSKPQGCAAYVPGEMGAEVEEETTIVTDAATEEEPIELEFDFAPAGGAFEAYDTTDRTFHNIQVDSKDSEAGFWARLESPDTDDPDLYVYWDNGTRAAVAGGFNQAPLPVLGLDGTGQGGHSGIGYEQIDGLRTADCAGWTLDLVNWLGVGGTYTLTLWLGEIENDPAPRE